MSMKLIDIKIGDLLRFLESNVKTNNEMIANNAQSVDKLSQLIVDSDEKLNDIKKYNTSNFNLSRENAMMIQAHNEILNVLKEYRLELQVLFNDFKDEVKDVEVVNVNTTKKYSLNECLNDTISGKMPIDDSNPYIFNPLFVEKALEYFVQIEDYEKCSMLMRYKCELVPVR